MQKLGGVLPLLVLHAFNRESLFSRNGDQFIREVRDDRGKEPTRNHLLNRIPHSLTVSADLKRSGAGFLVDLCEPSGPLLFLAAGRRV